MDPDPTATILQQILVLAQSKPEGISDVDISQELPDLQPSQKAHVINKLLAQGRISLFKRGNVLLYRLKVETAKGADNEEKVVYSIIEQADNKGIWIRDIRVQSNLALTQLNKILKSLETKKFIKAVKSVAAAKKKVYMLYNLEPDRSVTGGAWYQDQDFESEFVDVLNQYCYKFLDSKRDESKSSKMGPIASRNATYASSTEVWEFILKTEISKVKLSVEDLEMILNTLVYDGKVERTIASDGSVLYRAIQSLVDPPGLITTPCGLCPVRKNCCDSGDVTPAKCQYFTDWLELPTDIENNLIS